MVSQCQNNFPFSWEPHNITYLGIKLCTRLTELYAKNFLPTLQKIQGDLNNWHKGPFSWFGRAAILKMNILPRLLYLLQAIPIKLPPSFFASYKRMCRNLLWSSHPPRLSWDKLTLPKRKGGIGLPDLRTYYRAWKLMRIVDWHVHKNIKDWIKVENAFAQVLISYLRWINQHSVPEEYSTHPLIGPTLLNFRVSCKALNLTPLTQNPDFPPGLPARNLTDYPTDPRSEHNNSSMVKHSSHTRPCPPNFQNSTYPFLNFFKSNNFFKVTKHFPAGTGTSPPSNTFVTAQNPKVIWSQQYKLLFSENTQNIKTNQLWETELSADLEEDWECTYEHTHKGSINISAQENR